MAQAGSIWSDDSALEIKRRRGADDTQPDDSRRGGSGDHSSSGDDNVVRINGVLVKVRGDGSIDDSQPNGVRITRNGLKLRGNGSVDDSQPDGLRIVGTRRNDDIFGTGLFAESVAGRQGDDDFICGNRRGSFYLDDKGRSETFMSIEDFGTGDNTVVCSGSQSNYRIAMTRIGGERGVGIFYRETTGKDLVAFLEDVNKKQLDFSSVQFLG